MPRRKKSDVNIQIYSLEFKSFKETPLKADNILRRITSLKDVDILEYTYYIVKYFDQIANSLKYFILIPLEKKLEERIEALKEVGYVNEGFLTIPVESDNELIQLLERVSDKLANYDEKEMYAIILDDDVRIDSKSGQIKVKQKVIPYTHPVNKFIIENMELAVIWFEIRDFLIVSKDGSSVATRFKIIERRAEKPDKRLIKVVYSTGKNKSELKQELVEHMFKLFIKDIQEYKRTISKKTFEILESVIRKRIPEEYQQKTIELVKNKFERSEPYLEVERVLSADVFVNVSVAEGDLKNKDIIPAFVVNYIIKKYYDELFYELLYDIKEQLKLIEKEEKLKAELEKREMEKVAVEKVQKKKESIWDKIKRIYVKDVPEGEKPPKEEFKKVAPKYEKKIPVKPSKKHVEKKDANDILDAILDSI